MKGTTDLANQEHLDILKQGVDVWNKWREEYPAIQPDLLQAKLRDTDLHGVDLSGADLVCANLRKADLGFANLCHAILVGTHFCEASLIQVSLDGANLFGADLSKAILYQASLKRADLRRANLCGTNLREANFREANLLETHLVGADLRGADFSYADLSYADLSEVRLEKDSLRKTILNKANLTGLNLNRMDFSGMDLSGANLNETSLIKTNFSHANLSNCSIYGIAAWDIQLDAQTVQKNLTITPPDQSAITVDNLKVAQFIYLLLNNAEIRDVIDTIATKSVLILGRFTPERKAVLDALREALRIHGYLPILFDFEKPASRDITETISTLAHLARFVIADLTDAKSIPQELMTIVPNLPSVAVQPLILNSQHEYGMFEHFTKYPWVLPVYRYGDEGSLLQSLQEHIIAPAEQKAQELAKR